ncbi:pyridoxal phosphate-dependent aminotransferase [Lacibacterium aquatile]|uniref:Aminotransferase n=1 Tax=Lacibacterium aquatile TaxID=1168082 RepID=A0ABW5DXF1_9PROT
MKVADRGRIDPFIVMEVMRAAGLREAAGGDVLHLEVGQPSTPAPAKVREAAVAALNADKLGYTEAQGILPLREALAKYYRTTYGVSVDPDRFVLTVGSSGAFLLGFLAAFDAGARVALASPGYPAYRNILKALDIEVVEILAGPETGYQPTPEQLEAAGPLDGVIVASPANPTGTILSEAHMRALALWCQRKKVRLISDEIYHGLTYGARATSALEITDDALIVNSFSKYFSMTGWRLGWMVMPKDLVRPIECLAQNMVISAPTLAQHAAVAAFDCIEELEANRLAYARNREILLNELPGAGFKEMAPADGAFYLYAKTDHLGDDSEALCRELLEKTGVAITPGIDFDPSRGRSFVRFSFAGSEATMVEAAKRLKIWAQAR